MAGPFKLEISTAISAVQNSIMFAPSEGYKVELRGMLVRLRGMWRETVGPPPVCAVEDSHVFRDGLGIRYIRPSTGETEYYCGLDCLVPALRLGPVEDHKATHQWVMVDADPEEAPFTVIIEN